MNICSIILFQYPPERWKFSSPSLAHSELVHISENLLCKETPTSIWDFAKTLPVFSVYKSHFLRNFQCLFCL